MGQETGPMSDEELSAIYRTEMKTGGLTSVRKDLYRAMAALQRSQKTEYTRILAKDPDSIIAEGLNQRRKTNSGLCEKIVGIRMRKILKMAVRGAEGADNPVDRLTDEEKTFYEKVYGLCLGHMGAMKALGGGATYSSPDISESPKNAPAAGKKTSAAAAPVRSGPVPEEMPEEDGPVPEDEEPEIPDDGLDMPPAAGRPAVPPSEPEYRGRGLMMVRVTEDLPTFAGPTQNYTLRREDVLLMPENLAQVLIAREKAVEVRPSP